ncbi:MAG: hypothetical protein ABSF71_35035 [Terriglobia bacterium]
MLRQARPDALNVRFVRQFGIAFEPTDAVLDQFQEAGAGGGLLAAVLAAGAPESKAPLGEQDILSFVVNGASGVSGVRWIRRHGIDFQPTEEFLTQLRTQGAKDLLLSELRVTRPRPWSKEELLRALSSHKQPSEGDIRERELISSRAPKASLRCTMPVRQKQCCKQCKMPDVSTPSFRNSQPQVLQTPPAVEPTAMPCALLTVRTQFISLSLPIPVKRFD